MSMPAQRMSRTPNLGELLQGIVAAPPIDIGGIRSDSRRLAAGDVFLACRGERSHGLDYADEALRRKAAAIVWDDDGEASLPAMPGVVSVPVPDLGRCLGTIANRWFDTPSASLRVTGVTGTNGKTTVTCLVAQCLRLAGRPCGYLGTLGAGVDTLGDIDGLTTPDCIELHRQLAAFRDAGAAHASIEVSSHALQQQRVDGIRFDTAVFTNLSRDHIDYHGSMEAYADSKARLFLEHAPNQAIIGMDSSFGRELARRCGDRAIIVAAGNTPDPGNHRFLFATAAEITTSGITMQIDSSWGVGRCRLPLYGTFNISNACSALAVLLCNDIAFDDALELLGTAEAPPGRLQQVLVDTTGRGPRVFVDYAHTPAALEAVLAALRPHCDGALWCVFGCGGDRDRGKRPQMGEVVERLADQPVVTSDNPRSEEPEAIIRDIRAGMSGDAVAITDRAAAIARAIDKAADDDIVLIAGKGHETCQLIGEQRIEFSDYRTAADRLRARNARWERQ